MFSFFNWIFIPKSIYQGSNGSVIIQHERIHVQQKHSIDLIIIELIRIFQWFNPFHYLITKEIKENHEYLADQGMKESNLAYEFYKALLFQQTTGIEINPIANHFSYSLLKKRMTMMKKQKPQNPIWTKFGWTALAFVLVLTACNQSAEKNSETKQQTSIKELPPPPPPADTTIFTVVEQSPEFIGGTKALMKYLGENIKYPVEAKKEGIQGRVFVNFIIEKDGSVSNARILRGIGHGCDKEALRVVEQMPKWIPGKQRGEPVRVVFTLPIQFKLE
ncbi:MAG: TonB family protein [Bacteroidales bacterium]|nr:TonB family protein [Bacteroidales bacterium]